jgi:hypothetical protein
LYRFIIGDTLGKLRFSKYESKPSSEELKGLVEVSSKEGSGEYREDVEVYT